MKYDRTLKSLFRTLPPRLLEAIFGRPVSVVRVLPTELTTVASTFPDFLAQLSDGSVAQIEFQTTHEEDFGFRMARYWMRICEQYRADILQAVLWVGNEPCRIPAYFERSRMRLDYLVADAHDLDGEWLLESPSLDDRMLALLCRVRDQRAAVARVIESLASATREDRNDAFTKLLVLCELRGLKEIALEEAQRMPIDVDLRDVIRSWFPDIYKQELERMEQLAAQRGIQQGLEQGMQQGIQQGIQQGKAAGLSEGRASGMAELLLHMLERRFGPVPDDMRNRILAADAAAIERWSDRVFEAKSIYDIFA